MKHEDKKSLKKKKIIFEDAWKWKELHQDNAHTTRMLKDFLKKILEKHETEVLGTVNSEKHWTTPWSLSLWFSPTCSSSYHKYM